jgi:hypothetical protein
MNMAGATTEIHSANSESVLTTLPFPSSSGSVGQFSRPAEEGATSGPTSSLLFLPLELIADVDPLSTSFGETVVRGRKTVSKRLQR